MVGKLADNIDGELAGEYGRVQPSPPLPVHFCLATTLYPKYCAIAVITSMLVVVGWNMYPLWFVLIS